MVFYIWHIYCTLITALLRKIIQHVAFSTFTFVTQIPSVRVRVCVCVLNALPFYFSVPCNLRWAFIR